MRHTPVHEANKTRVPQVREANLGFRAKREPLLPMFRGLQLASTNCIARRFDHAHAIDPVHDVEITPEGDILAPEPNRR